MTTELAPRQPTFVSAVVYARDAGPGVAVALRTLSDTLGALFALHEIVLVDDGSQDETATYARACVAQLQGSLLVVELPRSHGRELAMLAGLSRATGDWVYELDDPVPDHDLDLLRELYITAARGHDIVAASPGVSSTAAGWFYRIANRLSYLDEPLSTERTRLVSRRALNAMLDLKERTRYRQALYSLTGFPKITLTYRSAAPRRQRLDGRTLSLALDVIIAYSDIGPRVAELLSLLFGLFSVGAVGYVVAVNLFSDSVVEGWTTLMVLVSVGLAGTFLTLGLIAEYLARILREVRSRPLYVVERETTHLGDRAAGSSRQPNSAAQATSGAGSPAGPPGSGA
ncbi:MAG: glycosyltransferase [Actinobacteria bacterium]|nr:glycosyltransferase [Actinomycetota bacterium]